MSEQIMRENLFVIAQTYATAKGLSLATVSKQIHGNQAFLAKFIEGELSTTLRTYYAMIETLRENWPRGARWPKTAIILRPPAPSPDRPVPEKPKPKKPPKPKKKPKPRKRKRFRRKLGKKISERSALA